MAVISCYVQRVELKLCFGGTALYLSIIIIIIIIIIIFIIIIISPAERRGALRDAVDREEHTVSAPLSVVRTPRAEAVAHAKSGAVFMSAG